MQEIKYSSRKTVIQMESDAILCFENFDSSKKMLCMHDHIVLLLG